MAPADDGASDIDLGEPDKDGECRRARPEQRRPGLGSDLLAVGGDDDEAEPRYERKDGEEGDPASRAVHERPFRRGPDREGISSAFHRQGGPKGPLRSRPTPPLRAGGRLPLSIAGLLPRLKFHEVARLVTGHAAMPPYGQGSGLSGARRKPGSRMRPLRDRSACCARWRRGAVAPSALAAERSALCAT